MTSLSELAAQAATCTRCDLYRHASGTVFGEGPAAAELMLVGETPGDVEDKQGKPFVGPAGRLLDRALGDSGISRERVYLTNAVVGDHRGKVEQIDVGRWQGFMLGTVHPSAVLRARDSQARDQAYGGLVEDLTTAVRALVSTGQ